MTLTETAIPELYLVENTVFHDERGSFTPVWVAEGFKARGLDTTIVQYSVARNHTRGTIRGLHYQTAPFREAKTILVTRGALFDIAVDLRPESPTFKRWVGVELVAGDGRMLYLPAGTAHGYQTLTHDTEVLYTVSAPYAPSHSRGLRWDDPAFGINWPLGAPSIINERDRAYPDFDPTSS